MNKFPSMETVKWLREQYPCGCRIELVHMDDPYAKLKPGDHGSVDFVDDAGVIQMIWDCGSTLGLIWGADQFKKNDS